MATFTEIFAIITKSVSTAQELRDKIASAAMIIATDILQGDDTVDPPYDQAAGKHDLRVKWAILAIKQPLTTADELMRVVVAANSGLAQAAILSASDAAIQANAEAVIDSLSANLV